ncbi:unnamed protein product [Prorocentrum cordatum]|uniref:Uncharacterized protein n=1 Tax=Prorocentrum cordatum TaxID=2364126 RepID=A0ABN9W891_9DINO|nr:unnamed protein product [Polarella glacialis]
MHAHEPGEPLERTSSQVFASWVRERGAVLRGQGERLGGRKVAPLHELERSNGNQMKDPSCISSSASPPR